MCPSPDCQEKYTLKNLAVWRQRLQQELRSQALEYLSPEAFLSKPVVPVESKPAIADNGFSPELCLPYRVCVGPDLKQFLSSGFNRRESLDVLLMMSGESRPSVHTQHFSLLDFVEITSLQQ